MNTVYCIITKLQECIFYTKNSGKKFKILTSKAMHNHHGNLYFVKKKRQKKEF